MINKSLWYSVVISIPLMMGAANVTNAQSLVLSQFEDRTKLSTNDKVIDETWSKLKAMGTNEFLGGAIGNFKLDEASMIAGALTIGASEFDNFLRTGILGSADNISQTLMHNMQSVAGLDLSKMTGSFTSGGGNLSQQASASFANTTGATSGDGLCSPDVAQNLVDVANKQVEDIVSIATSEEHGFSSMAQTTGGQTGFAGTSCLDKLFQNAGSDVFFKPPSLGNLTNQLQNWSCNASTPVMEQIAGAFPQGSFETAAYGGFVPDATIGEVQEGNMLKFPGAKSREIFGDSFAKFEKTGENVIKQMMQANPLVQ